jgi:D-aspartate ligase
MTALVFNCRYNGLSIIRELGRRGVDVLALDCVRSVGTLSRYARYHRCPDPLVAEGPFIQYLLQMGPSFREKPVLFPTNDHWAIAISRHKERLSQYYLPCVADYSCVELVILKQRFYEWALGRGVPVPRSWRGAEGDQVPDDAFPLVAKPEYRRMSGNDPTAGGRSRILDRLRLTVLKSRGDLDRFVVEHRELLPFFLFQEYVRGLSDCMYTVGVYANCHHEVMGLFTGRKVRGFPPDAGDCIVGQVEDVPPEIKDLVKRVCKDIRYHGIAEFEFKRDAATGAFRLIEINPRSWSWVGITPACGVSLPWMAYADLTGAERVAYTESTLPAGSVKWVRILSDFRNCLYSNRRLGYAEWHMTPRQWWKSLKAKRLVVAELALDDPLPGLYAACSMIRAPWRRVPHEMR